MRTDYETFNRELEAEMEVALKGSDLDSVQQLAFKLGYLKQKMYFETVDRI